MTIATTDSEIVYTGDGVTTTFATGYYFLLDTDLVVTYTIAGPTTVTWTLNFDYTVAGAGSLSGGSITTTVAPAVASTLTIGRAVPVTQLTDYITDDAFPAESHEKALDKLTMVCQQLQTNIDNAVIAASTSGEVNTAANIGSGLGWYRQKSGVQLRFRTVSDPAGGLTGIALYDANTVGIDVKYLLAHANTWTGGQQYNEFTTPATGGAGDLSPWVGLIHNQGTNADNIVALTGHAYHDATFNNTTGGVWGIATEAWSNPVATSTLIGGEFSVISQYPINTNFIVGVNAVFKNRADIATHPTASVGAGPYYNRNSTAVLITSQARPSGAGAAWAGVGSGWQTAIRIGDPGYGSGLDWEGGTSGGGNKKYSTILNMEQAGTDLAGGFPWLALWRTGLTYFGIRFNATITTGALEELVLHVDAAGAGYALNDVGTIDTGGTGGTYKVTGVTAGAVTGAQVLAAGTGYHTQRGVATTATTGGGAGLKLWIKQVTGERIEFWRMTDPGAPASSGTRYGFIDFAYTPLNDQDGPFVKANLL